MQASDAREAERQGTLKGAAIERPGKPEMRCLITNISDEGAELKLEAEQRVPQHFLLHVPHHEMAYRAEVRWRDEGRIGVAFRGAEARPRPVLKAV